MEHFPGAFEPMFNDCSNPGPVPLHKLDLRFTTHSRLLDLPIEILNIIAQYLPEDGLGGLALTNSDCRQIARARQFCEVKLKFSNRDVALIEHIVEDFEQYPRRANMNTDVTRSVVPIGHCVRAIIIGDAREHENERYQDFLAPIDRLRDTQRKYIGQIVKACNTEGLLPNLELLDLTLLSGQVSVPLWQSMRHNNLRYLKLPDSMVEIMPGGNVLSLPPEVDRQFRCPKLQRLELRDHRHSYTSYSASLETLSHFASSLESLTWISLHQAMPAATYRSWTQREMAPLVNLRRASLCCAKLDSSFLQAMLASSRLTMLELINTRELPFKILNQHGTISTLRHFTTSATQELLPFISCNPQITQLRLQSPLSDKFISGSLLPLLIDSFHSLECLALNWKETTTSDHGLYLLSSLHQLTRLFLSAGLPNSWRSEFLIDHSLILSNLTRLTKLRELFFYHDTYDNGHGWSDPSDYYQHRRMNETGDLDYAFQPAHERFEIIHKRKMTAVARDYARDIAGLEWLFVGQYAFVLETTGENGGARSPRVLCDARIELEREDPRTARVMRRMFGSYDPTFG